MYGKGARVERVDIDNWPKKKQFQSYEFHSVKFLSASIRQCCHIEAYWH
jgi:hypothetical protein